MSANPSSTDGGDRYEIGERYRIYYADASGRACQMINARIDRQVVRHDEFNAVRAIAYRHIDQPIEPYGRGNRPPRTIRLRVVRVEHLDSDGVWRSRRWPVPDIRPLTLETDISKPTSAPPTWPDDFTTFGVDSRRFRLND